MPIIREECRIGNLYIIDTGQFNLKTLTSVFCWYDGERALLMDAGTSDNTGLILDSLIRSGIPLSKLAGVVPSHYHFDHGGGSAELWRRMQEFNTSFRIYTTLLTKYKLLNSASHLRGAGTTFGKFVGTMEPVPDDAFVILEPDSWMPVEFRDGVRIKLLHTPGHTPDHCSPSVFIGDRCVFCYAAETLGTMYTMKEILTTPSSMPPNFNYRDYRISMERVMGVSPEMIGLCHFGVISGKDDIDRYFSDHLDFMEKLRDAITAAFREDNSTAHVMSSTAHLWEGRFDMDLLNMEGSELFFRGLRLALTYGLMVDMGIREPKYEERFTQQ